MLGTNFGCALIADGTVQCWGNDLNIVPGPSRTYRSQPMPAQPVAGLTDVTQIASLGSQPTFAQHITPARPGRVKAE